MFEEYTNWDRVDRLEVEIQEVGLEILCGRASKLQPVRINRAAASKKSRDQSKPSGSSSGLFCQGEKSIMKHAADMFDIGNGYNTRELLELIANVQWYLFPEESAF